jgi:hypothetical protein
MSKKRRLRGGGSMRSLFLLRMLWTVLPMVVAVSFVSCQRKENTPDWRETADVVAGILEHGGKYIYFGRPEFGTIKQVKITPVSLIYQFTAPYRNQDSDTVFAGLVEVSVPLDALDVGSFKVAKSDFWSEEHPIYNFTFYCLHGKHARGTTTRDQTDQNRDGGLTQTEDVDHVLITLADEESANRLAHSLKHLAILAGSPKERTF